MSGIEYNKFKKDLKSKFSQKVESSVELINIEENKEYSLLYKTPLGENIVKYLLNDIDDENLEVEYIEKYYTDSFWNKYNNMIVEFLMSYFLKKKKKTTLKQIEQYIKTNRKI